MDNIDKPQKLDISYMGPIFKEYREKAERTQEEVAEKVGITMRFLMALENENRIPGDVLLHPQLQTIDSEDEQLIRMMMRLNARDKKVLRAAIQMMLDEAE